jgi:hypothetical protein
LKQFSSTGEKWTTQRWIVEWSMLMPRSAIISFIPPQAQAIGQIPANAQQDHRSVEMSAFEHETISRKRRCPTITEEFATQPLLGLIS